MMVSNISVLEEEIMVNTVEIINNSGMDFEHSVHTQHNQSQHLSSVNQEEVASINAPLPSIMSAAQTEHGSPSSTAKRKVHKHKSLGMIVVSYSLNR